MTNSLVGESMFQDEGASLIIHGGLAFRSDGYSRSEIEITDLRTGESETMVFAGQNRWLIVYQLILLIREHFTPYSVLPDTESAPVDPCPECGGRGGNEDDEGNWCDCVECAV